MPREKKAHSRQGWESQGTFNNKGCKEIKGEWQNNPEGSKDMKSNGILERIRDVGWKGKLEIDQARTKLYEASYLWELSRDNSKG
jgi:hypothetical protein